MNVSSYNIVYTSVRGGSRTFGKGGQLKETFLLKKRSTVSHFSFLIKVNCFSESL